MSSSSSDCESDDYDYMQHESGYNGSYGNVFGRNPFYPTMGHPLIYYAQVPQPISMTQRGRERRRDSPNCFVKAFRWYTQEHVPCRNVSPCTKPDMSGFAAWLDNKYHQFVQESQVDSDTYRVKLKQTSVFEAERIANNSCRDTCPTKKQGLKSPWRKRRRTKSNEAGDNTKTSNHSFQYILQPKEMSRMPSECWPNISTATIVKSDHSKKILKSQSYSNISIHKSEEPITIVIPVQEGSKITSCPYNCEVNTLKKKELELKKKVTSKDFGCQYSGQKPLKVNAQTQYDARISETSLPNKSVAYQCDTIDTQCDCESITLDKPKPSKKSSVSQSPREGSMKQKSISCLCPQYLCQQDGSLKIDAQTQYESAQRPSSAFCDVSCDCSLKDYPQVYVQPIQNLQKIITVCPCEKQQVVDAKQSVLDDKHQVEGEKTTPIVRFCTDAAQTSNHTIHFGKGTLHEYPLFMKIVCADKLSEEI